MTEPTTPTADASTAAAPATAASPSVDAPVADAAAKAAPEVVPEVGPAQATPAPAATEGVWARRVTGEKGVFGHLNAKGFKPTVERNFNWEAGNKGMAFARGAGVAVGAAMAGDALFRGKTADGENRGALARVGQFVVGTGLAAGSLVGGRV